MSVPFEHYLGSPQEINTQELRETCRYINSSLLSFGLPETGDLFSEDLGEIKQTITCLHALLAQRQKDLNMRVDFQDKMNKVAYEKNVLQKKIDSMGDTRFQLENEIGKSQNKLKQESERWKKEREKIVAERDELKKECNKLIGRETHIWHELKKKENMIEKMKEQLRKALGEKDLLYMNHVDLTEPLHKEGPQMFGQTGESEFNFMITRGYEENQNMLLAENQELRSAFEILQREIHTIMDDRKAEIGNPELINIDPAIFDLPFQTVGEDVISTFQENLRRFKVFIEATSK